MSPVINWPTRQPCPHCGRGARVAPQLDVDGWDVEPIDCVDCGSWIWPASWLWHMVKGNPGFSLCGAPYWVVQLVLAEQARITPRPGELDRVDPHGPAESRREAACRKVALLLRDL